MIAVSLEAIADIVGGELVDDATGDRTVSAVTIDSRTAGAGTLFVALAGEHTDGHRFIDGALEAGAAGALARADAAVPGCVAVDDPADALLGLGAWVRTTVDPLVVAVTGSSGKTTTKDLIRAAVGAGRRVIANVGSYNNELGVPLTCCALEDDTEVLVAEVGARGTGHIAAMAKVLRPSVAVVTNVGSAHLEMFATVDGVARAKSELVTSLDSDGIAVLNADDPRVAAMAELAPGDVILYGHGDGADFRAVDIELDEVARPSFTVDGVRVEVPLPGTHNVSNALAALAAARACGVDLALAAKGLHDATVSRWRMELLSTPDGVTVVNDAYNANPSSMTAALQTLARMSAPARRWAVLGHMAELGAGGEAEHRRMGSLCAELGLDGLLVVGELAAPIAEGASAAGFGGQLLRAANPPAAVELLRDQLEPGDLVLIKASRSVGLESIATALTARQDAA